MTAATRRTISGMSRMSSSDMACWASLPLTRVLSSILVVVEAGDDRRPEDPERVAALRAPPLAVRALPFARGDIVAAGVAEDAVERLLADRAPCSRLPMTTTISPSGSTRPASRGQDDVVAGAGDAGERLEEERGRVRRRPALQVARVVQADADDGARLRGRQEADLRGGDRLPRCGRRIPEGLADDGDLAAFEDAGGRWNRRAVGIVRSSS